MRTDLFDFDLPDERIALRPAVPRESARLLEAAADGTLTDRTVADLPDLLQPGDVLVLNNTRVIRARLRGVRYREGGVAVEVEAMLHRRIDGSRWAAFLRPAKRVRPGDSIRFGSRNDTCFLGQLDASVESRGEDGEGVLSFSFHGPTLDEAIEASGEVPLPPYIATRRAADAQDASDYQTAFARVEGSVAAPTAGLHMTDTLLQRCTARGVETAFVTLHVGAGTFLPVKADDTADHRMHAEWGDVDASAASAINDARARGGRIVAVGSTALRLLESAAAEDGTVQPFCGTTDIFITPGHQFRTADLLLTNFHLPRSTLFMLVAAFSGLDRIRAAYAHAIAEGYRFYSYGDACLLHRSGDASASAGGRRS